MQGASNSVLRSGGFRIAGGEAASGRSTKSLSCLGGRTSKSKIRSRRRAFTLVEAIAAVALVGIGITASLSGLSVIAKTDRLLMERERMQRLALRKYEEIVATGQIETADLSGDFADQNIDDYEWNATVEPSGEENLEMLTVTVNRVGATEEDPQAAVDGLVFTPPIQGGAGAQ